MLIVAHLCRKTVTDRVSSSGVEVKLQHVQCLTVHTEGAGDSNLLESEVPPIDKYLSTFRRRLLSPYSGHRKNFLVSYPWRLVSPPRKFCLFRGTQLHRSLSRKNADMFLPRTYCSSQHTVCTYSQYSQQGGITRSRLSKYLYELRIL